MVVLVNERKDTKGEFIVKGGASYLHEENELLKNSVSYLKTELNKFKELPLLVCEVRRVYGEKAVIRVPNGSNFYVNVTGGLNLAVGDSVLVEQRSLTVVQRVDKVNGLDVDDFIVAERPSISWACLGGLEVQIKEIREVVELPLLKPELFKKVGIIPPKGILLYGLPGTGKTLLAKAVATSSNSTFIEIVAPELVQKFIGEGARLVREVFKLAREKAPSIIFIDEIDALAAERMDAVSSGEREVQRTLMQLLTEIDGFSGLGNVKVIAATNRFDILDDALLRPGRFDRLIEVPLPTKEGRKQILQIHSNGMNLDKVDFGGIIDEAEGMSGAELRGVCTEAGYFAIRDNRVEVDTEDFIRAVNKIRQNANKDYKAMFG